jgi:replicative DNA helicase
MIIVAARPSMGKAQPLDAKVLTPAGFRRMGDLRAGDALASIDGAPSEVVGVYPQGVKQVYRVTFADGRSTECCGEHLWLVYGPGSDRPTVLSTDRLRTMLADERLRHSLSVDRFDGTFGDTDAWLRLDPWLLGSLLGNYRLGGIGGRAVMCDPQLAAQALVEGASDIVAWDEQRGPIAAGVIHPEWYGGTRSVPCPLTSALELLGLADCTSEAAFIPSIYLDASRDARVRLLCGLLGRESLADIEDRVEFVTSSSQLAADVVQVARSIGGIARPRPKADGSYCCELIGLGATRGRRLRVSKIEPTRVTSAQCIAVSHPSRLYVTDDYVVTHNTAIAMNMIEHIAADTRLPCAIFSLEMSKQQLAQRMLCSRGQIDAHKLRKGLLQSHEYAHLANVVGELAKAPIWVDDSPGLTILDLRAKARRLKLQHDIKCVMIDYMQLMDNPGVESRQQQISEISRGIKAVARELSVPVICLSQLNRQSEGRDGHRPRMSDLRESGSIEQDADVIMLLHREDYYRMSEPDFQPDNIAEVIIAKQRNGPTGTVKLTFLNKTTRFENLSTQADPF